MIFTSVDPRYTGRLDIKQSSDTIVTMERVREAIAFNAELKGESTWYWLTSEQIGVPFEQAGEGDYKERAEDSDSDQRELGMPVASYLRITRRMRHRLYFG